MPQSCITKKILRKTKRGQCIYLTRKVYLRLDIPCGWAECLACAVLQKAVNKAGLTLSSEVNESLRSKLIPEGTRYILIPDVPTACTQFDFLQDDAIKNVILLQSVLEEVAQNRRKVYGILRDVVRKPEKQFYVFSNLIQSSCYVAARSGESKLAYNQRLVLTAASWYAMHLKEANVKVVLLTDDKELNTLAAVEHGTTLTVLSAEAYVQSLPESVGANLLDKLAKSSSEVSPSMSDIKFPPHLSLSEIQLGLRSGKLVQGTLYPNRYNTREAQVRLSDGSTTESNNIIFISGAQNMNRAIHEDIVAVEILPKEEWISESNEVVLPEEKDEIEEAATTEEAHLLAEEDVEAIKEKKTEITPASDVPNGRIVGIIRRKFRQYCGILQPSMLPGANFHLFVPVERRIPKIRIETRQAERLAGKRIVVSLDNWLPTSRYPSGHFVRILGNAGDKATENAMILLERDVPHERFAQAVLDCLPKMPWVITEEGMRNRQDLRHLEICSIDPPGCTDIDDALHYRELPNGNAEVGVHIADVSYFVRPGNAMDREASHRGTTVYLTDQRIDMLPELLSSNLCSLRGGEERFAFSAIWELNPRDASTINVKFTKSLIKSSKAMTYQEAQSIISDKSKNDSMALGLRKLLVLSKLLKKRRVESGALALASSEIRFNLDTETHDPIGVQEKAMLETNSLVEEFMLLANCAVADFIYKNFRDCAVLRRHPVPTSDSYGPLIEAAATRGFQISTTSGIELAKSLDSAQVKSAPYFNTMLRMIATRCMTQAVYFAAGTIAEPLFTHFGLAAPIYTHFTSPIRRYPDVLVHRLLAAAIHVDDTYPDILDKHHVEQLCNHLNHRHKMAQYAGRDSVALHTVMYFAKNPSIEPGYILFVKENALQILVPKFGLEVTLPLKGDGGKLFFSFDKETLTQKALEGAVEFKAFDSVKLSLSVDNADGPQTAMRSRLRVRLVEPKIPGFSVDAQSKADGEDEQAKSKRLRKS